MKRVLAILMAVVAMTTNAYSIIYEAEIQSFGNYSMEGKTFYIISANPNISNKDLEFMDYKDYITQCIILKNGIPCENSDSADVCILFDYGIVDKSYVANVSVPVWGITGTSLVTTTSRYVGASGIFFSSTTTSTINTGITGIFNKTVEVPKYRRVINLYAYDNKERVSEPIMLWKINIMSEGEDRNLQEVLPYIAYSGIHYMGKQSNGIKTNYISSSRENNTYFIKNKYYLKDNVYFIQPSVQEANELPVSVHSVVREETCVLVNLIAKYVEDVFSFPKFKNQTYIVHNGQKYPIQGVYYPCGDIKNQKMNYLNKGYALDYGYNLIQMRFPIALQEGDKFDIISYSNKKETKTNVHFKDIILQ